MKVLREILDPELGISIVDLGLIYSIKVKGHEVFIEMTLTSPGCPIASEMISDVENAISKLKEVSKVKVDLVFDPPWTLDRISAVARAKLGI